MVVGHREAVVGRPRVARQHVDAGNDFGQMRVEEAAQRGQRRLAGGSDVVRVGDGEAIARRQRSPARQRVGASMPAPDERPQRRAGGFGRNGAVEHFELALDRQPGVHTTVTGAVCGGIRS